MMGSRMEFMNMQPQMQQGPPPPMPQMGNNNMRGPMMRGPHPPPGAGMPGSPQRMPRGYPPRGMMMGGPDGSGGGGPQGMMPGEEQGKIRYQVLLIKQNGRLMNSFI